MIGFEFLASVAPILAFRGLSGWRVPARPVSDCVNPRSGLEISPGVRIWYVPHDPQCDSADQVATFLAEDVAEFAAIRDTAKRQRSLKVRAALRTALSETVDGSIAPKAWRFGRTETDKPVLLNGPEGLSFSCSHTKWASIVAVSATKDVGVDIEEAAISATDPWLADAFTAAERAALTTLPPSEREHAVARLWTLKEAYLKMLGTGIADLLEVAFDPRSDRFLPGQKSRKAAASFQTWIVNCQGQPLSVAVAIRDAKTKGAFWRQWNEECRGRSRAKFVSGSKRAGQRTAIAAPLLRGSGPAAAGAPGG